MQIYGISTFQRACRQFDLVADRLQIPDNARERLKFPKRSLAVALPVRLDDGSTKVFSGHRVQHHLTLGPTKGGLRYHPDVTLGDAGGAMVSDFERVQDLPGFFWSETEITDKLFRILETSWTQIPNHSRREKSPCAGPH